MNMTSLVEKYALLPNEIDELSLRMVEDALPDSLGLTPAERYVVCRIVRAEGDPDIARDVRFSTGAVERGLGALKKPVDVVTDVRMVEVGISRSLLNRHGISTHCMIDTPSTHERARREGTTRSVAAVRELAPRMNGAVVAIGNAPTALLALLDLVRNGEVSPALVIGMPVGFVACAESKEELLATDVPFMSIVGRRGGSSAAAATVNALLSLMSDGATQ